MGFDLSELKKEYEEIIEQISNPDLISDWEKFEELSRRKKKLDEIIGKQEELEKIKREKEENNAILASEQDHELVSLAENELIMLKQKQEQLEKEMEAAIKSPEEEPSVGGSVIVEIRAGAGGGEAALFAENIYRMYSRYAQVRGWSEKILDSSRTEIGGLKEIVFELKNGDVYSSMKYEGGVHRVQRVPETEKSGRVHTSTASVIILLKPKKGMIKISPQDLKIDTYKASGPGGQYVNKRESAIRITHLPTGTVVTSQTERSLAQNKENAMSILEARVMEKKQQEQEEKIKAARKSQVLTSDRSEKIRTYNYLQDRITDHRIKKNWHNIENILNGNIDSIIESLQEAAQS